MIAWSLMSWSRDLCLLLPAFTGHRTHDREQTAVVISRFFFLLRLYPCSFYALPHNNRSAFSDTMSESDKKTDPPKKPEARVAGAPSNREDVFNTDLPEYPDDKKPTDENMEEKKYNFKEALREHWNKARRGSAHLVGLLSGQKDKGKDEENK